MSDQFYQLIPKKYTTKQRLTRSHTKEIVLRHGHIAITDYEMGDNREFEKALSVFNEQCWKYELKGGYYVPELKEFRINRGYDLSTLASFFRGYKARVENDAYPSDKVNIDLLAPPRDDFQRVGLTFMCSQNEYRSNARFTQQLIDADTGEGKAQPDDTMIPTPTGLRRLDSLRIGDMVFNINGKPVEVTDIYPQKGMQETYEVTFKDGRKTRCNGDHLWHVIHTKSGKARVVPLKDMLADYAHENNGHTWYKYAVPMPGAVKYKHRDVSVDPYVLGVLIGNGCLGESALTISSGNLYVPAEVAKILGCPTRLNMRNNYSYEFHIPGVPHGRHGRTKNRLQTKDILRDYPGLIGCKSGHKFIPDDYKYNSIDVRRSVLQGLLDTDGHIDKNRYRVIYTTVSKTLRDDIIELARSLGYKASYSKDRRVDKYTNGTCYTINIRCPDEDKLSLFRANRKSISKAKRAVKYKTRNKFGVLPICNIKRVESTKQRCIRIDDPTHVYLTEHYIPTHNTYLGTAISGFMKCRSVIFVPFAKLLEQWKQSYLDFTSLTEKEILIVTGSDMCKRILKGKYSDVKVFIFSIETFDSFCDRYGNLETIELLRSTNAYVKIVDEIHRNMKIVARLEALSNFHMNYYMSASPGRANKKENWIFKMSYTNIPRFGSSFKLQEEKHINIMVKRYRFIPTPQQQKRMIQARTKWLNTKLYERELINSPEDQIADFIGSLKSMLKWSKGQVRKENKILMLAETIDGTAFLQNIAEDIFPGKTSRYYASMKNSEKAEALKATVICATVSSLGTGADIPGIQHVHNITTYSNWISVIQTAGRARRTKDGSQVFYIEYVNMSYIKTLRQYEKRKPNLIKKSKSGKIMLIE